MNKRIKKKKQKQYLLKLGHLANVDLLTKRQVKQKQLIKSIDYLDFKILDLKGI